MWVWAIIKAFHMESNKKTKKYKIGNQNYTEFMHLFDKNLYNKKLTEQYVYN